MHLERAADVGGMPVAVEQRDQTVVDELAAVNDAIYGEMRLIDGEPGWNEQVERATVVLSASRSGSSLLYKALSSNTEVAAPAGEHEPWLFMSENKYPFIGSDEIVGAQNTGRLLHLLRNDLLIQGGPVSGQEYADLLHNRLTVRRLNTRPELVEMLSAIATMDEMDPQTQQKVMQAVAAASATQKPLNNVADIADRSKLLPIENPPYIDQPLGRRATDEELRDKTLLFKSPPDAYRPGLYENLFPNADINYVHLTRGYVQTTNGLMDGWSKREADFISNPTGLAGQALDIEGYSHTDTGRNYWCFDLYPGWQSQRGASLLEVCTEQWLQAHSHIIDNFDTSGKVAFESFYTHRRTFYEDIERATGIDLRGYDWSEEVMTTERPAQFRWLKREQIFRHIEDHLSSSTLGQVVEMQETLGYSMEASTWH